jgi:putative FmdB family regulatory protein
MPTYEYKCKSCENQFEKLMKIAEMDQPTKEACPSCGVESVVERLFPSGAPALGDPYALGITKPGGAFKERMQEIKRNHPNSKINI